LHIDNQFPLTGTGCQYLFVAKVGLSVVWELPGDGDDHESAELRGPHHRHGHRKIKLTIFAARCLIDSFAWYYVAFDAQRKVDTLKNAIKSTFKVYILVSML
jgi:hypothetical protein